MATSGGILSFLDLLDEVGTDLGYMSGYVHDTAQIDPKAFRFLNAAEVEEVRKLRAIVSRIVKARQEPCRELTDEMIQALVDVLGEQAFDECITRLELRMVPSIVTRWKKLRALHFVGFPEERVTEYLRQATTCYLHGLPTAAVILCGAVLEFSLEEAVGALGGTPPRGSEKGLLAGLINGAGETHTLPPRMIPIAKRIQARRNRAVHKGAFSEDEALAVMRDTREVLKHLYKTPRRSSNLWLHRDSRAEARRSSRTRRRGRNRVGPECLGGPAHGNARTAHAADRGKVAGGAASAFTGSSIGKGSYPIAK